MFLHVDSEDSDQTGGMTRLIWVLNGHTSRFVGFVMLWLKWPSLGRPRIVRLFLRWGGDVHNPLSCVGTQMVWKSDLTSLLKLSHISHDMTKPTKWAFAQWRLKISMGIRPVWWESSLCAQWVAKDPSFCTTKTHQTGWMPRLNWVFAGRIVPLLVLSCRGSYHDSTSFWFWCSSLL